MKKIFYLLPVLLFAFCAQCVTLDKIVKYKDVELRLPAGWEHTFQEPAPSVYQILCLGNNGTFLFQWMEAETELEKYFDAVKEPIKNASYLQGAIFSKNQTGFFRGVKTIYSTFSGKKSKLKYAGTLIAFCSGGRTFFIMHQGDMKFYSSKLDEKIMESLKANGLPKTVSETITSK